MRDCTACQQTIEGWGILLRPTHYAFGRPVVVVAMPFTADERALLATRLSDQPALLSAVLDVAVSGDHGRALSDDSSSASGGAHDHSYTAIAFLLVALGAGCAMTHFFSHHAKWVPYTPSLLVGGMLLAVFNKHALSAETLPQLRETSGKLP